MPLRIHKGGRESVRGHPEKSDSGIEDREVGSTLYISVSLEERCAFSEQPVESLPYSVYSVVSSAGIIGDL